MQLRSASRYHLAAAATFRWQSSAGGFVEGQGITRDISVKGAFILTPNCPPAGIVLNVEVCLPQFQNGHPMKMVCEGRVIRVEHPLLGERRDGFAILAEDFAISSAEVAS